MISVILPVLHDEPALIETLSALVEAVADGVLRDAILIGPPSEATDRMADAAGALRIKASGGREALILQAARQAKADWLMIVTPGLVPTGDWIRAFAEFPASAEQEKNAGFLPYIARRGWIAMLDAIWMNAKARLTGRADARHGLLLRKSAAIRGGRLRLIPLDGGIVDRRR